MKRDVKFQIPPILLNDNRMQEDFTEFVLKKEWSQERVEPELGKGEKNDQGSEPAPMLF